MNSARSSEISSGMAYYGNENNAPMKKPNALPQDYIDVTQHGLYAKWEGQKWTGHFNSGVSFTSTINAGADNPSAIGVVGNGQASGPGFTKSYTCYKPVFQNNKVC